jgi:3-dehydroquinate dehydratase
MNVIYRDLNDKEVVMSKHDFIQLIDEYTELKQQVKAMQEVLSNIVELKGNIKNV